MVFLPLLALLAGSAIAVQASMNAHLGVLLRNSLFGTAVAFCVSSIFTLIAIVVTTKHYPSLATIKAVPYYMWFTGAAFSSLGVSLFYFLIPRLGIGPTMSFALTAQIIVAVVASHFGWFDLPQRSINGTRLSGIVALLSGIYLINWK